jgi:hypothetical protein
MLYVVFGVSKDLSERAAGSTFCFVVNPDYDFLKALILIAIF